MGRGLSGGTRGEGVRNMWFREGGNGFRWVCACMMRGQGEDNAVIPSFAEH